MQFSLLNLLQAFFNFLHFQAFGVSGAASLIFIILSIGILIFSKVHESMKSKTQNDFFEKLIILFFAIWLLSFSSILGPFFFYFANYACTSYEATSCFLTSIVAVSLDLWL
jgi:hypothetical protein